MPSRDWGVRRDASTLEPNFGNTVDDHHPVGLSTLGSGLFRTFIKFDVDTSSMVTITSATLHMRSTARSHTGFGSSPTIRVKRLTSTLNNTQGGSSEGTWSTSANPAADIQPSSTTTDQSAATNMTATDKTWDTVDVTAIAQAWFDGDTNYGVLIKAENEGTTADTWEFYSNDSAHAPYIRVVYTTNVLPTAPTLTAPTAGAVDITGAPTFIFSHNDADGDPFVSYDIQVGTDPTLATVSHWDGVNQTLWIAGTMANVAYSGILLTRGATYYWRARTNDGTGDGAWSSIRSFLYNALPTVVKNSPLAGTLGIIHNIAAAALWTPGGTDAQCAFRFTATDTAGGSLSKYRLRIYDAVAAGNTVYDSGEVALTMGSGVQINRNIAFGMAADTERWWTIMVYDGYEWSAESSRTAFKLLWSQGLWEFDTGAGSTNWSFATGVTAGTVAVLFRSATSAGFDAATGKTAFSSSIGSVLEQRYLQILVRLTTSTSATPATLADMALDYYGVPSAPDGWAAT